MAQHLFCCLQKATRISAVGRQKGCRFTHRERKKKSPILCFGGLSKTWRSSKNPEHRWARETTLGLDCHGASLPSTRLVSWLSPSRTRMKINCHPPPLPVLWGTGGGSRGNTSKFRRSSGDGAEGCLPWGATRSEKPLSKNWGARGLVQAEHFSAMAQKTEKPRCDLGQAARSFCVSVSTSVKWGWYLRVPPSKACCEAAGGKWRSELPLTPLSPPPPRHLPC